MLTDRVEAKWIESFAAVFRLCGAAEGEAVRILSESQSRALNVQLAELALFAIGARPFHIVVPTPRQTAPLPVRSTGASQALQGLAPVLQALSRPGLIVDLTLEGLLHAPELPALLKSGARVMMVSNEHPDVLERLPPDAALTPKVKLGMRMLKEAREMRVTSGGGTDLVIGLEGARSGGVWGYTDRPGSIAHWPGGLCLAFPKAGSVNGRLVLAPGDANLTFKRYLESEISLRIENDYVTAIEGRSFDAELMRDHLAAWGEPDAYAVSHVGWGMNPRARWDAMVMYDKRDINGTELRAFAGNFLFSTGANETAGRFTQGHFDLPLRRCTIRLDGEPVVVDGKLQGALA
ncbi:2,5-dihydroxypyridine 5,6-dioxygenase [Rhizobiales bacterium GAS191]|nr:2,5-dihydroxypyridine 5,6-dioxygenase [Rhizobiales bacterium GAS113]SEC30617.1 2,5-dihydroxypyridine 5,6-dioxygenase [Rhizobiales bacterium GAS191]SEC94299.1 2,5-dihydroxypyridine 5,6-dioxygenase [Rhizobiales bacterium GAS188]